MFHKTVFDNVACPSRSSASAQEIRRRVFNTPEGQPHQKMWELPGRLSYGEQQRVAIARPSSTTPSSSWPTSRREPRPELAFEIVTLFKEINKQGATVIIGSHDRELIRHFGDNILFLRRARSSARKPTDVREAEVLPQRHGQQPVAVRTRNLFSVTIICLSFLTVGIFMSLANNLRATAKELSSNMTIAFYLDKGLSARPGRPAPRDRQPGFVESVRV